MAQTTNHESKKGWALANTKGGKYVGANPFTASQSAKDLDHQLLMMQLFLWSLEKWTNGWWSVIFNGAFQSTLYGGMGWDGTKKPNFQDGTYYTVISATGNQIVINTAVGQGHDPRGYIHGATPIQVQDYVALLGNNCALGMHSHIVAISGIQEGLSPARPSTLTLTLDKDVGDAFNTSRDSNPVTRQIWIGREYNFPQDWYPIEYPSFFYGVRKSVVYDSRSAQWSSGAFRLKDDNGDDCAVSHYFVNDAGQKSFWVRALINGNWVDVDCSSETAEPRRCCMVFSSAGAQRITFNTTPNTIDIQFKEDVTGLGMSDFSVTNITKTSLTRVGGADDHYRLHFTVNNPSTSPQDVTIELPYGAANETGGQPTHATRIKLEYNTDAPDCDLTSSEATNTTNKAIDVMVEFFEADGTTPKPVYGFSEADITPNADAEIEAFGGDGSKYTFVLVVKGASPSVQVAATVCKDEAGNDNAVSNTLAHNWTTGASYLDNGLNRWYQPDPVLYTTGASTVNSGPIPCVLKFHNGGVGGLLSSELYIVNATLSNWVQVASDHYTFDLTPSLIGGATSGMITCQLPADLCYHAYLGPGPGAPVGWDVGIDGTWPGVLLNTASNTLSVEYLGDGPTATLTTDAPTIWTGSLAHVVATFDRPVAGVIASAISINGGAVDPVNIIGTDVVFEFDVPCLATGAYTIQIPAGGMVDRAGNLCQDSNTLSLTVTDPGAPGAGLVTNRRLFVTHDLGDQDHESCESTVYLGSTVNGVAGYEDLRVNVSAFEINYFYEVAFGAYNPRACRLESRRCVYCRPDYGGVYGYTGPDGRGYRWYCAKRNESSTPQGLSNFGAQCYLVNGCQYFEPVPLTDYLYPAYAWYILQQMWIGIPGAFAQIFAGDNSIRNWKWQRVGHPSITGFLTPALELAYTPQYTPQFQPQGCGNFGFWDVVEEEFHQGVAHDLTETPTWTTPNTGTPSYGTLPAKLAWEGWCAGRKNQRDNAVLDNDSDPYGEWRSWPFINCWGASRDGSQPITGDLALARYCRLNQGNDTSEQILIPAIAASDGELQVRTHGAVEYNTWRQDLTRTTPADPLAYYGAMVRILPHPHRTDNLVAWSTGYVRSFTPITGGYRIECYLGVHWGQYFWVDPAYGPTIVVSNWYGGYNVVGAPEWARNRNPLGYENATLVNAQGPAKGAREGYVMAFLHPTNPVWLTTWPIGGDPGQEVPAWIITKANGCAGAQLSWQDNGPHKGAADDTFYDDHIAPCGSRPYNEKNWGSKADVLEVADPSGTLAALIAAGTVVAGSRFAVANGTQTFGPEQGDPNFFWTRKYVDNWQAISSADIDEIDFTLGLYAVKLATAQALFAEDEICFRVDAPQGRLSQAAFVSARDINDTLRAMTAIDTTTSEVYTSGDIVTVQAIRYQMLSYFSAPSTRMDWTDSLPDPPQQLVADAIAAKGRTTSIAALYSGNLYTWAAAGLSTDPLGKPWVWNDPDDQRLPPGPGGECPTFPFYGGIEFGPLGATFGYAKWGTWFPYYWYFLGEGYVIDPWYDANDDWFVGNGEIYSWYANFALAAANGFALELNVDVATPVTVDLDNTAVIIYGATYDVSYKASASAIRFPLLDRLPDGVTIAAAYMDVLVTIGTWERYVAWEYYAEFPMGEIKHWNEFHTTDPEPWDHKFRWKYNTQYDGFYTPAVGACPDAENFVLESGDTIGDVYGAAGTYDLVSNPAIPSVKLALVGVKPNGDFDWLGVSLTVRAYYTGDPAATRQSCDVTNIANAYMTYRKRGYLHFALVVISPLATSNAGLNQVIEPISTTPCNSYPWQDNQKVFPLLCKIPHFYLTNPDVTVYDPMTVQFTATSATPMAGAGPLGNLPHFK